MGSLGDLGGLVVANVRVQGGDQHKRFVQQFVDAFAVGDDAVDTVGGKAFAAVAQQSDGPEHVGHHHRFEYVQFEVAVGTADGDGHVVAHNLGGDHGDGLALGRVDFAGHDGAAGLVFGKHQFAQSATRSGCQKPVKFDTVSHFGTTRSYFPDSTFYS